MNLTLQLFQKTLTMHTHSSEEELRRALVASFGPDVDAVLDEVLAMVEDDIATTNSDPLAVLGGALSILLLTVASGGDR